MQPIEILGICSAAVLLAAFVLNEYGKLPSESLWYDAANCIASLGLLAYAWESHVWPFVITNTVWAAVSGVDVVRYCAKRKGKGRRKRGRR